jgi:DNA recombination protein RmuC
MDTFLIGATLLVVLLLLVAVVVLIIIQIKKPASVDQAARQVQLQLSTALQSLGTLNGFLKAREKLDADTSDSVRRLEMIIAGTQTKGIAGENILDVVLSRLPAEWQARGFMVNGAAVEFGVKLPNGLVLPIDSKWPATHLIEQFIAADKPEERKRLKAEIEHAVLLKAKEIKKYLDPSITMPYGVACVPDSVFDLVPGAQVASLSLGVVLISHSMLLPYLLLVYQSALRNIQTIDTAKLEAYLKMVQASLQSLQEELDGRFARALTMLSNSRDDMRALIGKANGGITSLQIGSAPLLEEQPDLLPKEKD